jgi:hypothetical protein
MLPRVRSLNVLHFKSRASLPESFTTFEFISSLEPLQFLRLLHITDLDLTPSTFPRNLDLPEIDIELEDLSDPMTVYRLISILGNPQRSVTIAGCAVYLPEDYYGALTLKRIPISSRFYVHTGAKSYRFTTVPGSTNAPSK